MPRAVTGDIDGSPSRRGARVYVGSTAGLLWSIRASDGLDFYSHTPTGPPEPIKGFPFPDRGSQALYFTTTSRIHSAVDNGPLDFQQKWLPLTGLTSPSTPLFWAAQNRLYVGMQAYPASTPGAWLYDVDAATGAATPIQLESGTPTAIGAPSLEHRRQPCHAARGKPRGRHLRRAGAIGGSMPLLALLLLAAEVARSQVAAPLTQPPRLRGRSGAGTRAFEPSRGTSFSPAGRSSTCSSRPGCAWTCRATT